MEEKGLVDRGTDMERIRYFSDAVFAIAITLLVLQIRVPEGLSPEGLTAALVELWPKYSSYVTSFWVIGSFWSTYHRIFRHVKAYDGRLISLNLLFLMCVAFLPFPVSLVGEYADQRIAFVIYAGSITVTGSFLPVMWWYATQGGRRYAGRLTDGEMDPVLIRQTMTELLFLPTIGLIAVPITFFFGVLAAVCSVVAFLLIQSVVKRILPRLRTQPRAREEEDGA